MVDKVTDGTQILSHLQVAELGLSLSCVIKDAIDDQRVKKGKMKRIDDSRCTPSTMSRVADE